MCIFAISMLARVAVTGCSSNPSPTGGAKSTDAASSDAGTPRDGAPSGLDAGISDDSSSPEAGEPIRDAAAATDSGARGSDSAGLGDTGAGGSDSAGVGDAAADGGPVTFLGVDPPMGWTSWSFVRRGPTEAVIEAEARALHDSGLSGHGFVYVNIDDFYYVDPSRTVDPYGRWVTDTSKFPNGMAAVADFVHRMGLKFGMYVTPGIPAAAVTRNTPIEGTNAHAADVAITTKWEKNFNFGNVMHYIDYAKPGAQEFVDSWAKLLASWGVDGVKIDGVGEWDMPDVRAWSAALRAAGRTIRLDLSSSLAIADATTWESLANGWRIDGDVECYCWLTSFPLTNWGNVSSRFAQEARWAMYSKPGGRNDLDSLEIGNGQNDGLTPNERTSVMSLWALSAAPLMLGADLTNLDPADMALLTNDEVIAVDQAGVAATQVVGGVIQEWIAKEPDGSFAVGLFNLGTSDAAMRVPWSDLEITGRANVRDLWLRSDLGSFSGSYQVTVHSHGVALLRISQ